METHTFNTLAAREVLERTTAALTANGFLPETVASGAAALARIKELIPAGVSVMNGASVTLEQIGFVDYLKTDSHGWNNLHAATLGESDPVKKAELRKQASLSDYYLGSAHAVTETGELIFASNTGSQMPHLVFTSPNLILVVSTQKLVKDVVEGMRRIGEYVVPLEDVHMQQKYGAHTSWNKTVMLHKENPMMGRKVYVLLVEEALGF